MNTNTTLILIGIVIALLGIAAGIYEETQTAGIAGILTTTTTDKPYQDYSIPLIVGGIILLIVGAFIGGKSR
ncbi:hypothetical protein BEH94_01800 [Candidatus Altiarchaeales archaeon WOR_SM1_SCG]|nr:hypothetical protein BEH94_01800 [Candidatus Altiarchaeales archaeon WOR_SM1_SCG]